MSWDLAFDDAIVLPKGKPLTTLRGAATTSPNFPKRSTKLASSHGARIQTSRSSSVVRMTGIAFA